MRVHELVSHPEPYVTVAELAEYWLVGRKQIYKQIDAGTLPAIRLGPRLLRIRTADALAFERSANMRADAVPHSHTGQRTRSRRKSPTRLTRA